MPHSTCGLLMRSVSTENGSGGSSPGCGSVAAQSMVVPSSRGGVPVFSRPSAKPARSSVAERPTDGASPTRPAGICWSPIWIRPRRKVPVVSTTAAAAEAAAVGKPDARRPRPSASNRSSTSPSITVRPAVSRIAACMAASIELAVGLGARPAHGRPLAAVEQPELDAGGVGHAAHQAIERVDLAHQMALAQPADRRIAGHRADRSRSAG